MSSLTVQAGQTQGLVCAACLQNTLALPSQAPPLPSHVPTLAVPWGRGLAPLLTGAVGGHVVVGVLAVVLDGCLVGGQVVPGGEGDKAMLQLRRRLAISN